MHDLYFASAFLMSVPNFFLLFSQFRSFCCVAVPSRTKQDAVYAIVKVLLSNEIGSLTTGQGLISCSDMVKSLGVPK